MLRAGDVQTLVIDKALLEILEIAADTQLKLRTDGTSLIVSPVRAAARRRTFRAALKRVNDRHGRALRKLAE